MFDEKVDQLNLTDTHVVFTVRSHYTAAYIAEALAWNAFAFDLKTRHDDTTNEWTFAAPRHALGTLRTL